MRSSPPPTWASSRMRAALAQAPCPGARARARLRPPLVLAGAPRTRRKSLHPRKWSSTRSRRSRSAPTVAPASTATEAERPKTLLIDTWVRPSPSGIGPSGGGAAVRPRGPDSPRSIDRSIARRTVAHVDLSAGRSAFEQSARRAREAARAPSGRARAGGLATGFEKSPGGPGPVARPPMRRSGAVEGPEKTATERTIGALGEESVPELERMACPIARLRRRTGSRTSNVLGVPLESARERKQEDSREDESPWGTAPRRLRVTRSKSKRKGKLDCRSPAPESRAASPSGRPGAERA